jgi:N-acetyltransferase
MRTYSRNVRRAWDGEDYCAPKRQRLDNAWNATQTSAPSSYNENFLYPIDLEDSLERAIRETSVAAMSSSPSRKNSTIFSAESHEEDMVSNTITPPSSPPPALQLTPPNVKARKPTFAFLDKNKKDRKDAKRKRDSGSAGLTVHIANTRKESTPLSEIFNSSTRVPTAQPQSATSASTVAVAISQPQDQRVIAPRPANTLATKPVAPKNLIQTVLDLGQSLVPKTCLDCGMSYTPSIPEDVHLHTMYHNRDTAGIELSKPFLKSAMRWCYTVPSIPGSVVVVDRKIALPARRAVQKVLEIVNKELGSVDIKEEELWSQRNPDGQGKEGEDVGKKCDRYKVFLHVIDDKCVGVCLAERIVKAHRVVPVESASGETIPLNGHHGSKTEVTSGPVTPAATETDYNNTSTTNNDNHNTSTSSSEEISKPQIPTPIPSPTATTYTHSHPRPSSISITEQTYPAVVGVSRIWTSRAHRHKGIAANLLECVMSQFIYGMEIEREQVAFSQPTEAGAGLARSWFGEDTGWGVYRED